MPNAITRPYRQVARAATTDALRERICAEFLVLFGERWLGDITLDEVAARAGTTRQTVIRLFGGKDGLVDALADDVHDAMDREAIGGPASSLRQFAADLVAKYEVHGDVTVHALAQERRHPSLRCALNRGRALHRAGLGAALAPWLDRLPRGGADRMDALVAATDVYFWQLLRRDYGRSPDQVARTMRFMLTALLAPAILEEEALP